MPDTPVPLREALPEAIADVISAEIILEDGRNRDDVPLAPLVGHKNTRVARVAALLSHIPIELEVSEGGDER